MTIRLRSDLALGIEGNRVRARHVAARRASGLLRTVVVRASWAARRTRPTALAGLDATVEFWRSWLASARIPDHRWRRAAAAIGADHQGPDLHADRRDGGRADHLAAGDARRGTQLGLPLHLDAGHARSPCRRCTG